MKDKDTQMAILLDFKVSFTTVYFSVVLKILYFVVKFAVKIAFFEFYK